jgi:two-component system NtrC family sensor kinase
LRHEPPLPTLRLHLSLRFGAVGGAALAVSMLGYWLLARMLDGGSLFLAALVLVAAVAAGCGAAASHLLRASVIAPLDAVTSAACALARGDLQRRPPAGETQELAALAEGVNRMTDHLLDEHARRLRVEKLATVGRLAAGIAHEVGNPLSAVLNYAHVLRARTRENVGAEEALDGLEREAERIDRIVRGLLDYARPKRLTPTAVDVNDVVTGALRLLADQGVTRRVTIRLLLEERSPRVYGERHELEQVLVNVLLNAADAISGVGQISVRTRRVSVEELRMEATRREGDSPQVHVPHRPNRRATDWLAAADCPDDVVQVVVADSGTGVAPADVERIFDPFFTTKERGKGTGLGLAIVARTIDNLGGTVWVQRAREGGAAFVFLLPLAPATVGTRAIAAPQSRSARVSTSASSMHALSR